jgi:transposase
VGAAGGYRREKGSQPRVRQHGQNEQGLALGRKNYLFVGDEYSGKNVAGLCSLTATCEANTVDPLAYLTDVLGRIGSHPAAKIDELLPQNWKPAAPAPTL